MKSRNSCPVSMPVIRPTIIAYPRKQNGNMQREPVQRFCIRSVMVKACFQNTGYLSTSLRHLKSEPVGDLAQLIDGARRQGDAMLNTLLVDAVLRFTGYEEFFNTVCFR